MKFTNAELTARMISDQKNGWPVSVKRRPFRPARRKAAQDRPADPAGRLLKRIVQRGKRSIYLR